jgi:hypothetical protein
MRDIEFGKICVAHPCHCLPCWEEAVGSLEKVWKEDCWLKAKIGRIIVILPLGFEEVIKPLLGRRIAILRTDIPGKEYLFRVIPEADIDSTRNSRLFDQDQCEYETMEDCTKRGNLNVRIECQN